jgi:hypothetical protein
MANSINFAPMGNQVKQYQGLEKVADVDPRLTRSHYFDSRLLTAEDLNRDQLYLDGRLRELGQALGYGIVRGFELALSLSNGEITVQPGLGITRAGRVLELTRELIVKTTDPAEISELNNGSYRRIDRALYAVVVKYSEQGTDIAEVFPTDLGSQRRYNYDVMTEGVQFSLVRLPQPLAQQNELIIRANLLSEWINDPTAGGAVPEDGLALGVLAINNNRPIWLDVDLLRQPLRAINRPGDLQQDLSRRYDKLLSDVIAQRASASLNNDFSAADYFRLLPPVGLVPKGAIDPVAGRQGYFPEHFNISIAPVRLADLELVRAESMSLPPIDLSSREPIDIVVMVPMNNLDYAQAAQRLESPTGSAGDAMPSQNLLSLRLFPAVKPHALDSDKDAWTAIWNKLNASNQSLFYIRRPLRAAETRLSGIVLARGVPVITTSPASIPSPTDNGLYLDESSVILREFNLQMLANLRPPIEFNEEQEAVKTIMDKFANNVGVTKLMTQLLLRIEHHYDSVLWRTFLELISATTNATEKLSLLLSLLQDEENQEKTTAEILAESAADLSLSTDLVNQWTALGEE